MQAKTQTCGVDGGHAAKASGAGRQLVKPEPTFHEKHRDESKKEGPEYEWTKEADAWLDVL